MNERPHVDNAPGLAWRKLKDRWEARWRARKTAIRKGYPLKTVCVWIGAWPDKIEGEYISSRCRALQDDMLSRAVQNSP